MTDRLPHVRAPDGDPDVCVHCREEWVDLLTLYERDECAPRLRAALDAAHAEAATMRAWAEDAAKAENENARDLEAALAVSAPGHLGPTTPPQAP